MSEFRVSSSEFRGLDDEWRRMALGGDAIEMDPFQALKDAPFAMPPLLRPTGTPAVPEPLEDLRQPGDKRPDAAQVGEPPSLVGGPEIRMFAGRGEQLRWRTGPGASPNSGAEPGPGFQAGRRDDAASGPALAALLTAFDAMQTELNTVQAELTAMQATLTMQTEYIAPPGVGGPATSPNRSGHQQTDTNNDVQRGQVDASGGQTWTDGLP